jgi:pre-mRNA-splicing factor SYF1
LLYAKLEEEHGMARHAMAVYERATKAVLPEEMFEVRRIAHIKFSFFIFLTLMFPRLFWPSTNRPVQ